MGVDVGTTRTKAVVQTSDGDQIASASLPTPWRQDCAGTEMDPATLADIVREVAGRAGNDAVAAVAANTGIAAIGVTGMGEAGVLTGVDGRPLAPVRAWYDQRGDVERVRSQVGDVAFRRAVGMPLNAQPSLPKILALQREYPQSVAAQRFWSVPEWAVRCLGGEPGSELSLASRTGLIDVVAGAPWGAATELVGAELVGPLTSAGTPAGVAVQAVHGVDGEVPHVLRGAVLTVAGHDHQTAAFAAGAVRDGVLFDSLGTAEALVRFTAARVSADDVEALAAQGITVGLTVVAGYHCMLAGLLVGLGLERVAVILGATTLQLRADLGAAALEVDPLPQTAHLAIVGNALQIRLDGDLTPPQLWARAVHDLVGASDDGIAKLRAVFGDETAVIATGGWLANPAVLAVKRRQFPQATLSDLPEAGAAGAALLAGTALSQHRTPMTDEATIRKPTKEVLR
jgi:sugar (pentulose or hexulose) kinase